MEQSFSLPEHNSQHPEQKPRDLETEVKWLEQQLSDVRRKYPGLRQPIPNQAWCPGCTPESCPGCGEMPLWQKHVMVVKMVEVYHGVPASEFGYSLELAVEAMEKALKVVGLSLETASPSKP